MTQGVFRLEYTMCMTAGWVGGCRDRVLGKEYSEGRVKRQESEIWYKHMCTTTPWKEKMGK